MVGFVDDYTCISGGKTSDSFEELKIKMTQDVQLWHDLLWASGGKLELSKCGYHLIYYEFNPEGIPKMKIAPLSDKVILTNDKNDDVPINAKSIFTPRLNLGHYKSPAGNRNTQATKLKEKAKTLTDNIIRCNLTRNETRMVF